VPYVRRRGNQLVLVHGEREPGTGKVQQRILFTFYSRPEALEAIGRPRRWSGGDGASVAGGRPGGSDAHGHHHRGEAVVGPNGSSGGVVFRSLIEHSHPRLRFDWKTIERTISENLDALPETYEYQPTRLLSRFREDLCAFARQLMLADPQWLLPAAQVIGQHGAELTYLTKLILWRLRTSKQAPDEFNQDNAYYWRFAMRGETVPPDMEEEAAEYFEKGDHDQAEMMFRLLLDCFDDYAEGYNYLGLIALERGKTEEAIAHFRKTIEVGRKLFPKRIAKQSWWSDHSTRPYMRGLGNLSLALNRADRYDEALATCDRLEHECGDSSAANAHRSAVALNVGHWEVASRAARYNSRSDPSESLVLALAQLELGQRGEALVSFLHGALNHPRAARMLLGERTTRPTGSHEARDHNAGVHLLRSLHAYLANPRRASVRFLLGVVRDPRVKALLDEAEATVRRWSEDRSGDRTASDRMNELNSFEFASEQATRLADLHGSGGRRLH